MADKGTRVNLQTGKVETFTVSADEMSWRLSVDQLAAESLQMLRQERNAKLAETDYLALSDNTLSTEMSAYRQALRDITNTYSNLNDVVWPEKP